jgi:hypothetical protein
MIAILGVALIVTGAWFNAAHKHLTADARYIGVGAMVLGGILVAAWLGSKA